MTLFPHPGGAESSGVSEHEVERLRRREAELEAEVARLRARADAASDASGHHHGAIFRSAVDFAIIATGRDGRVTDWNTGAERILGWSADAMRGEPIDRIFTPEDRAEGRSGLEMQRALEAGRANDERWHVHRDGSRFWASGEMMPLRAKDGAHLGFLKILRDRTAEHEAAIRATSTAADARAAAEALAAERSAILGQLVEGVIVADADGRITFVNDAASALHGLRELGVAPDHYSDAYHLLTEAGAPYPSHDLPLARAVRGETVIDARWRICRPDGSEVLAIGSARPIERPDGTRAGAVLTLRDDTARNAAETERSRLAAIVEQSRDFIGIADPAGRVIFLNEAGRAMVGLEQAETALGRESSTISRRRTTRPSAMSSCQRSNATTTGKANSASGTSPRASASLSSTTSSRSGTLTAPSPATARSPVT